MAEKVLRLESNSAVGEWFEGDPVAGDGPRQDVKSYDQLQVTVPPGAHFVIEWSEDGKTKLEATDEIGYGELQTVYSLPIRARYAHFRPASRQEPAPE